MFAEMKKTYSRMTVQFECYEQRKHLRWSGDKPFKSFVSCDRVDILLAEVFHWSSSFHLMCRRRCLSFFLSFFFSLNRFLYSLPTRRALGTKSDHEKTIRQHNSSHVGICPWIGLRWSPMMVMMTTIRLQTIKHAEVRHYWVLKCLKHRHIEWTADGSGRDRDTRGVRGR